MSNLLNSRNDYKLIPQKGVKHYVYPEDCTHNAIWDSNAGPDGKLYFGLATEISESGYVRLCSYDAATGEVKEHFRAEDVILPQDRAIKASKFHSSICFMPDGRIIMTTHTTDKSPNHPTWLPLSYYHHLWEGFAGGHILIYDPKTSRTDNLGIPVPHESIYGACYEPDTNCLFFTGWIKGHLYVYSLDTHRVIDLGKTSENNAFRLVRGGDGKIYGASRTGHLYRVDPKSLKIEDLNFQFKHETYNHSCRYNDLSIARTGPDGRLYMAAMYSRSFYALDTKTGCVEDMGHYLPADSYSPDENRNGVFGMDFDSKGVLWYVVTSLNNYEENLEFGIPAGLFRWDIMGGKRPEFMGIAGTPERACAWNSEVVCTKDDILYITGSNHSLDGPDLLAIDLKEFDITKPCSGGMVLDQYYNPDDPRYIEESKTLNEQERLMGENTTDVPLKTAFDPILLWRALAPDHIEDSAVKQLFYAGDTLYGRCGESESYCFAIENGELTLLCNADEASEELKNLFAQHTPQALNKALTNVPYVPGRQYKTDITAFADMTDGCTMVGTADGLLAIASQNGLFALGAPCANGPIHALAASPDGTVYGVAGDVEDLTTLFQYDSKAGLRALGHIGSGCCEQIDQLFFCTYVTTCTVSADGKYLAVGANERLGTVVVYKLK